MAKSKKVKLDEEITSPQNLFLVPDVKTLEELNKKIIDNSQLDKFTEVKFVNEPVFEVKFIEHVKNDNDTYSLKPAVNYVNVETRQVSAVINKKNIEDINKQWGIDALELTKNAIINEASHELSKSFITKIQELANHNYVNEYTNFDKFKAYIYKFFKKEYTKKIKVKNVKDLLVKILNESNIIAAKGRYGFGDYAICNLRTATALQQNAQYAFAPTELENNLPKNGMIYPIGTIGGVIIYVDPYMLWNDTNIYIGRKIRETEPGIKFYFKDSEIIEEEKSDKTKLIIKLRCAMTVIGENAPDQYRKIEYKPSSKLF